MEFAIKSTSFGGSSLATTVLGRFDGEATFNAFLGESQDLISNIHRIAPVTELDWKAVPKVMVGFSGFWLIPDCLFNGFLT